MDTYVRPEGQFLLTSYAQVPCPDCGGFLVRHGDGTWGTAASVDEGTRFRNADKAHQAAMAARWLGVPPPGHAPHDYPFGTKSLRCTGGSVACDEVRKHREQLLCPDCRA